MKKKIKLNLDIIPIGFEIPKKIEIEVEELQEEEKENE